MISYILSKSGSYCSAEDVEYHRMGVLVWRWHCDSSSDDVGDFRAYKMTTPSLSGKRTIHGLIFE